MPKTIISECNDFVNEYGDTVIQLLIQMTDPSEICRSIGLCDNQIPQAKGNLLFFYYDYLCDWYQLILF